MAKQQKSELKYTALMKHNAESIEKLVLMQYNSFQVRNKLVRVAFAFVMLVYGVVTAGKGLFTSYLCLILGSMILAGLNVRPKSNARKLIAQMNGTFPSSEYYFTDHGFRDSKDGKEIPYQKLIRLIDDKDFLYLYISKESAYMVDNRSVYGADGLKGLKTLIKEKTGLSWRKPSSFWTFNIYSLQELFGRTKDAFEGERLRDPHR